VRRDFNIEWNGIDELTPWRFALSRALGVELPECLRNVATARFDFADAVIPAVALQDGAASADLAGARGILSSSAMVDLYSQVFAEDLQGEVRTRASSLREAYVAQDPAARLAA